MSREPLPDNYRFGLRALMWIAIITFVTAFIISVLT